MKKILLSDEKNKKCGASSSISCELIIKCPQGINVDSTHIPIYSVISLYTFFQILHTRHLYILNYIYIREFNINYNLKNHEHITIILNSSMLRLLDEEKTILARQSKRLQFTRRCSSVRN